MDLVASFEAGNTFKVKRLAGGKITPGEKVRLSLDVLGGLVGQVGDGSHCNSFAEPRKPTRTLQQLLVMAMLFLIDACDYSVL